MRAAALDLLLGSGPRSVTLNAVAQRSLYSIGAVYQRWSDRNDLLRDLLPNDVAPMIVELATKVRSAPDTVTALSLVMDQTSDGPHPMLALAELLFAARDDAEFLSLAQESIGRLVAAVEHVEGGGEGSAVLSWWLVCSGVGASLLRSLGTRVPDLGGRLDAFLAAHGRVPFTSERREVAAGRAPVEGFEVRPLGQSPVVSDPVALGLVEAGVEIVGSEGVEAATARSIAGRAGVSTGALYRRFRDRDALLADVLVASLGPERYTWVQAWVDELGSPERAAHLMADTAARAWTDEREARLLLELSVAAHVSGPVREEVAQRIYEGIASREEMFCVLHDAGLLTTVARADLLGWLFQLTPIGGRLLGAVGVVPDQDQLRGLMSRFLTAVVLPEQASRVAQV